MATENYLNRNGHAPVGAQYTYAARPRSRKYKSSQKDEGLSNGLIILVIAIVVGCFAVLWPKYFYPMFFGGEPGPNHNYDPEKLFMEGPHGREYMRNKLKDGGGHPGVHPGTGDQSNRRATPPIRPAADVRKSKFVNNTCYQHGFLFSRVEEQGTDQRCQILVFTLACIQEYIQVDK